MKREYGLEQIVRDESSVVTVGTFDGVHVGHQVILRYLLRRTREQAGRSVVVSFDPHPREVLRGEPMPLLTTIDERADVFEQLGIDRFIVLPFTKAFSKLSPEKFVENVLVERIGLKEIVIGYDHGFGRGREGDSTLLKALGAVHGFDVDVIPAQEVEHLVVSSTKIRQQLVDEGDVILAAEMLGRPYTLRGRVIKGDGRGRTIGFPTANIEVDHVRKIIPRRGVYAVQVRVQGEGMVYGGMMNIGVRPTFDGQRLRLEVHVFDLDGDLYGKVLHLAFRSRIREEQKFDTIDELVAQLVSDQEASKRALHLFER